MFGDSVVDVTVPAEVVVAVAAGVIVSEIATICGIALVCTHCDIEKLLCS